MVRLAERARERHEYGPAWQGAPSGKKTMGKNQFSLQLDQFNDAARQVLQRYWNPFGRAAETDKIVGGRDGKPLGRARVLPRPMP